MRPTSDSLACGAMDMTETTHDTRHLRAALIPAAALAIAFVALLWPATADAQTKPLRAKCLDPTRTLNVAPSDGSATTFSATEPVLGCVTGGPTSFRVRQTCTFHCQHWHTWVPTGTPQVANVRLKAAPAAGSFLVDWSDNCTVRLGQDRRDCTVRVGTNPTTVTARLRPTPDVSPPTAPGAGVPTPGSYNAVIRWSPSSDDVRVAGYDVLRDGVLVARAGRGATSIKVGNLSCQADYSFRVEAFDASGNAASSTSIPVRTGNCGPTQKPNTAIHVKPPKTTKARTAFFHFGQKGSIRATKYQCKLDKGRWVACSGTKGKRYRGLRKGYHTFQVRAGNSLGWDATPAKHRWRIT